MLLKFINKRRTSSSKLPAFCCCQSSFFKSMGRRPPERSAAMSRSRDLLSSARALFMVSKDKTLPARPHLARAVMSGPAAEGVTRQRASAAEGERESWCKSRRADPPTSSTLLMSEGPARNKLVKLDRAQRLG